MQFLRNGRLRVSFHEKETHDHFLSEGMRFEDEDIPVTKYGQKVTVLFIRDLPYEVASDDLIDFFSSYDEVLTVERSVAASFPNLCNGNIILKLILNEDLPHFLSVWLSVSCVVSWTTYSVSCVPSIWSSGPVLPTLWPMPLLPSSWP